MHTTIYHVLLRAFTGALLALSVTSVPATAQVRWLAYHENAGAPALFRQVQWDSIAAVIFDANGVSSTAGTQTAQIFTSDRGTLRLLGTVLMPERTYSDLRGLIASQSTRWLPALVTRNGSPYRNLKAYVDIDRAASIGVRPARDENSVVHADAYIIMFNGSGPQHPVFAVVDADRAKVTARIDTSVRP
ncbi:MAG TPA: hypothetical protein VF665_05495 [Longimicrobium sp.]|jgi:hypothetical protein|uniref:hypothetical protein n=1 Tax=Longimicrobium sp. TaxID=2029185 RepID=UPI002ED98C77